MSELPFIPLGRRLMTAAADIFECPRALVGHRQEVLHARYAVMVVLHECDWSTKRIGNRLKLDHSTVLNGLRSADQLYRHNGFFAGALDQLRALAPEYRRQSGARP
jgi:chromosomal replication initiation ATPase DnaA